MKVKTLDGRVIVKNLEEKLEDTEVKPEKIYISDKEFYGLSDPEFILNTYLTALPIGGAVVILKG